jgi:hypothetical protein
MSDGYLKKRRENSGFVATFALDGGAVTATAVQAVKSANHQIYIQRVHVSHLTHADGKLLTIQDAAGTPVKFVDYLDDAESDTTWGSDYKTWDFGPEGVPITAGKNLDYVANTGGSGFLARVVVEGYQKLVSPVTITNAASGG